MKLPKRGEKGFTLVELLIVLAILAVLAAVVIPNVTGMLGRGAEQSYDTDVKTIQTGCATFYFDTHVYDTTLGKWNTAIDEDAGVPGHYYPYKAAKPSLLVLDIDKTAITWDEKWIVYQVMNCTDPDNPSAATENDVKDAAIWMGLVVNSPADGGGDYSALASVLAGEKGPYLNEIPESAAPLNAMVDGTLANSLADGTYLWILCKNGRVYGVAYLESTAIGWTNGWYAGFNGSYP